ncbi:plectin, partial [Cyclospora cayetanensis]|uniref:Plectin n=1 Tax=Cyclospora cayetanensis TaxID=88456 RepID=A0A6P6RWK8_9EIME
TGIWRLFRRGGDDGETEGKATRAHLGEENQFYYNKELKRWLIRGEEDLVQQLETPPPPPAATATTETTANSTGQPEKISSSMGNMRRMRARGAASLYTATPGLSTKSSCSTDGRKKPLAFVMPPYRLQQLQRQSLARGSQAEPESSLGGAAEDASPPPPSADSTIDKEGCRVRAAVSEPPLGESPGWMVAEDDKHGQQQQQASIEEAGSSDAAEVLQQRLNPDSTAQCSTGAPSPPKGEASAHSYYLGVQEKQPQQEPQLQPTKDSCSTNGVKPLLGVQYQNEADRNLPEGSLHRKGQEQKEGNEYLLTDPEPLQQQHLELSEDLSGDTTPEHQQYKVYAAAVVHFPEGPNGLPAALTAAPVEGAASTEISAAAEPMRQRELNSTGNASQRAVVTIGSQDFGAGPGSLDAAPAEWRHSMETQFQPLQQVQKPPQEHSSVAQPLDQEHILETPNALGSPCNMGAPLHSSDPLIDDSEGRGSQAAVSSATPALQAETMAVACPVAASSRDQSSSSASFSTEETSATAASHHPSTEPCGYLPACVADLQQQEDQQEHVDEAEKQRQLLQRNEQQQMLLPRSEHQHNLQQEVFMEDFLPGFARAVQDLEKSSGETLRQLAALQQQVGALRSRNACLTTNIRQVIEHLLSGEEILVDRQRAAQLVQDAIVAAAAECPSPMGTDSEAQPSPACSGISDAEAALEEAHGAVSALTQMLVEQMERNRQLQEEDMHFDADVVQFISQLQQQHGSLEPFLQQQLLLQEAHIEQQESIANLKRMHDDLSRRMEESCARAADLEAQMVLAVEKKRELQEQLGSTQQELQQHHQLLDQLQQEHAAGARDLQQQSEHWQQQLHASEQQLQKLQQETQQQTLLLQELQEQLQAAVEREAAATAARVAAEIAQKDAQNQVAEALRSSEKLQQLLQQREQEQIKLSTALKEKQEALDSALSLSEQQQEGAAQWRQEQEGLERQLLAREFLVEKLQSEVNSLLLKQGQLQEQHAAKLEQQERGHATQLEELTTQHAEALIHLEQEKQKLALEQQCIAAAHQEEVDRAQQKVDALQQQLAQQEEQHELMAQRQQEDLEQFLRRLQQQEYAAKEQLELLEQEVEEKRLLVEQYGMQNEDFSRQVQVLQRRLQEAAAFAEERLQSVQQQLEETTASLETERKTAEHQLQEAASAVQESKRQQELFSQKYEVLKKEYDVLQQQHTHEKTELDERVKGLEEQLLAQQRLLQAAREELLQQPIMLQQKHEEDVQHQLAALRQLELEDREKLQQEHDQILEQQQEKHALLTQQLREQHALEQQQMQQRMQQEHQEQQEALRSHFEHLWNEESSKMVAANAAVVEQLKQVQQLLLEEQQQLESSEAQREALAREREEAAVLRAQMVSRTSEAIRWEQRSKALEQQIEELLKLRRTPDAESQAAMEAELHQLRQQVIEKVRLSQRLQHQLDEQVASQRDRLGEVNAMLERQEEASKQKDLRLRSVEEELQALQQLLQDTVDVKQLEAARAEAAEGNRRAQRLESDLIAATAELDALRRSLVVAEEQLRKQRSATEAIEASHAEAVATALASHRRQEMREAGTQATGDEMPNSMPPAWEDLNLKTQKVQQRNEELSVRNTTLTRISDFLSRRLQFMERALAEMGPHGLVVIEDCDRNVVLTPADIEPSSNGTPVPDLVPVQIDAACNAAKSFSGYHKSRSQDPLAGQGVPGSPVDMSAETSQSAQGAKVASTNMYIAPSNSGENVATPVSRLPPNPPAFLRDVKASSKV